MTEATKNLADKPREHERLLGNSASTPPYGAKPAIPGGILGFCRSLIPVSVVAKTWGISPRRVRQMLEQGRLEGQQRENGFWEVLYPYRYMLGTRGPKMRQHREKAAPYSRPGGLSKREEQELKKEHKGDLF
jgi:hypothetical protein